LISRGSIHPVHTDLIFYSLSKERSHLGKTLSIFAHGDEPAMNRGEIVDRRRDHSVVLASLGFEWLASFSSPLRLRLYLQVLATY
jgi:hypothetical protein